ncbi:phosphoglycerate kinase [candidate division KSB1 bacterium]|nr:phosphoglycerate kinase [candidate division KSB1 bacterium]MBL7093254.1 phosphoglycerate kinase [candidate division KSB1 bacterium]
MAKLTIDDLYLKDKRILMRVDFNVPLNDKLEVTNDARINAALPTIKKIIESDGKAILISHLGRPKGKIIETMRLTPVAKRLSELINKEVKYVDDCIGEKVEQVVNQLQNGEILLLENLRFYEEETKNDAEFARQLAKLGDVYVNDAFGTAHRAHASTEGVTKYFDECAAGYLIQKELKYLGGAIENPERPLVAILGGAKISGKIDVIENLLDKVDALLIGGGMTYTFLKAKNIGIGNSLLEADKIEIAAETLEKISAKNVNFNLPIDHIIATDISDEAEVKTTENEIVPADWAGVDIGPKTILEFQNILKTARTVVWNGPMGVFEIDKFSKGTLAIAEMLADITDKGATTVVGGGDSVAALAKANKTNKVSHVSTGGGASLEFLGGIKLPGIEALSEK